MNGSVFPRRGVRWSAAAVSSLTTFFLLLLSSLSPAAEFSATSRGDYGNIAVMEVAGNYDAELPDGSVNSAPRQILAREFYRTHRDDYDFVVIFSNFDFAMPEAEVAGFYTGVRNDVRGIGLESFDHSADFGSSSHLQGIIDMGNLEKNVSDPLDPRFEQTIATLNHELLHRWGAHLKFRDPSSGIVSSALLGRDNSHWSYLLDTQGSLHYGSRWRDNDNGTFTALEAQTYFSPLDLYLMGMIGKEQVPPLLLIENPSLESDKLPEIGAIISGIARTVTIDEIIAVEGERLPLPAQAQKQFKIAFIYATTPGTFSDRELPALEKIRNGFLTRYSILTDGLGLVQVTATAKEELPFNPGVVTRTEESGVLTSSLDQGVIWLKGRQKTDGHWSDSTLTTTRDTAEVITALHLFSDSGAEVSHGAEWLITADPENTDYLARKVESLGKAGMNASAFIAELVSRQNGDGGWGSARGFASNPVDSALALKVLGASGTTSAEISTKGSAYLLASQNVDGGWAGTGTASQIQATAHVVQALNHFRTLEAHDTAIARGVDLLVARQNTDGGFGNSPSTIYDSAVAVLALGEVGAGKNSIIRGSDYLLGRQDDNGSWGDSSFQTAMAVQAVYHATLEPDLEIFSKDISFIPGKITQLPTNAVVNAAIRNIGRTAVAPASVALYVDEVKPENLLDLQSVAFPAGSTVTVTFAVPVVDGHEHLFYVVVDPDNLLREASESNNRAVNILRPETTYDFEILTNGLIVAPGTADFFANVTITATVRNFGTTVAYHLPLRLILEDGGSQVDIATRSIDIPANGVVIEKFVWKANRSGSDLRLTVIVDPHNAYSELNETNNQASTAMTVAPPTRPNLTVSHADITMKPDPAREGEATTIAAVIKNQGYSTIESVPVSIYRGIRGEGGILLGATSVSALEPGDNVQVEVEWVNIQKIGDQIISVVVDPENLIDELAEDDNEAFTNLQVLSLPDFSVESSAIIFTPAVPKEGDTVSVAVTISNTGDQERESVTVDLLEGGTVIGSQIVSLLAGNSLSTVIFDYGKVELSGQHELTVHVDPENVFVEGDESNNLATRTFNVQNGNLWLSEKYISPNGDGVQDSTVFGFRLDAPTAVTVVVIDEEGQEVRAFSGDGLERVTNGTGEWDGLDSQGMVVADGIYQIRVSAATGMILSEVTMFVDNNRMPLSEAIGTKYLIGENVYFDSGTTEFYGWLDNGNDILLNKRNSESSPNNDVSKDYGLFKYNIDDENYEKISPSSWLKYPFDISKLNLNYTQDFSKMAISYNACDRSSKISYWGPYRNCFSELWINDLSKNTWEIFDKSTVSNQWFNYDIYNDGNILNIKWSPDENYIVYFKQIYAKTNYSDGIKYDLIISKSDGSEKILVITVSKISELKWSNNSDMLIFCDDNYNLFISDVIGNKRKVFDSYDRLAFYEWINDSEILVHRKIYKDIFIFNIISQENKLIKSTVSNINILKNKKLMAIFSSESIKIYDLVLKDFIYSYKLNNNYRPTDSYPDKFSDWSQDGKKLYFPISYSNINKWFHAVLNLEENTIVIYDENETTNFYGSKRYGLWLDENKIIISGKSGELILLDSVDGQITYIKDDKFVASPMGYSPTKKYLYNNTGSLGSKWFFQSAMNIKSQITYQKNYNDIDLKGTASDINLDWFKIEYANVDSPDLWTLIKKTYGEVVVDNTLGSWIPPGKGAYYLRLTVQDKAGNLSWDRKSITWGTASGIGNLYKSDEAISPNGDGIKEAIQIHYRVFNSIHLTFRVFDNNNDLIKTLYKNHTVPGEYFISWDGRNELGEIVPDGSYRINVLDYDFFVEVDTSPPDVGIKLSQLDGVDSSIQISGHGYDVNIENWRVEFGSGENPGEWFVFAQSRQSLVGIDKEGSPIFDPIADETIGVLTPSDLARFAGNRFRIVAEDASGNLGSAVSGILPEMLLLYSWDGEKVSGNLPDAKARAGIHELLGAETFTAPLGPITLQYRVGGEWLDATGNTGVAAGLITVNWDNTQLAGQFNAVRLKAVDTTGQTRFSNELTTASIFSVAAACSEAISGTNYLFEDLSDLKYQYRIGTGDWVDYQYFQGSSQPFGQFNLLPPPTGQTRVAVRMAATGTSGKTYFSTEILWPSSCPASVMLTINYPEGACGNRSGNATLSAQAKGQNITPLTLGFFLDQESGAELLEQSSQVLSGSFPLDSSSMMKGVYNVRAVFDYLDRDSSKTGKVSATATLLVDRTLPAAQITYPAGNALTICPERFEGSAGPWHGIPVEAVVLDNVGVHKYELFFGAGENPTVWQPAMTRRVGGPRPIAGEGPLKGTIGVWDISSLTGTLYTLKLKVVDSTGNVACHTVTVAIDTLVMITDFSLDRRLFSPVAMSGSQEVLAGFNIGEAALLNAEVLNLLRDAENSPHLDSLVRSLVAAGRHAGGGDSIVWNGRDDGGEVVSDGEYALTVRATDFCGNTSQRWEAVTVDATPPTAVITYPIPTDPLPGIIEITGIAADAHFLNFVLEAGQESDPASWRTIASGATPIEGGILGRWNTFNLEGVWTLRLVALDRAGNERQGNATVDLGQRTSIIKSLEATPLIFSPNRDGTLEETAIAYEVTAASRIRIEIFDAGGRVVWGSAVDASVAGAYSFLWDGRDSTGATVSDGKYRVNLFATLSSNSDFVQTETVSITIDSTPPESAILFPEQGAFLHGDVLTLLGTVQDLNFRGYSAVFSGPNGRGEFYSGNQSRANYAFGQVQVPIEGSYVFTLEGSDLAGNKSITSRSFTIDRTPPQVALDAPGSGTYYESEAASIVISGTIKEAHLTKYFVRYGKGEAPEEWMTLVEDEILPNGSVHVAWPVGADSGLADGVYTVSLYAMDKSGLEGESRVKITIDNTLPEVAIIAPVEGVYLTGPVAISGTATDQNFKETVLELSAGSCATAYKWSPLKVLTGPVQGGPLFSWQTLPVDGNYCLRMTAKDILDNQSAITVGVQVDTHPPQAPLLAVRMEGKTAIRLEWAELSETDLDGYNLYRDSLRLNNEPLTDLGYLDADLAEGSYSYFVKAIDFAGNESLASNTVQRKVDMTPPIVKISSPANATQLSNYVDVKGTAYSADDFREYRIYIGQGTTPASWDLLRKSPVSVPSGLLARWNLLGLNEGGAYTLKLEAEDLNGNTASSQVAIAIDNLPPQVPTLLSTTAAGADVTSAWQAVADSNLAGYLLFRNHQLVNAKDLVVNNLTPYLLSATSFLDLGVPDGTFDYQLVAMDRAGNQSAPSNIKTVTIDTRAPVVTIVEPIPGTKAEKGFFVRAESIDQDIASLKFQFKAVNVSTWSDFSPLLTSSPFGAWFDPKTFGLTFGDYQLRVLATDRSGKSTLSPSIVGFTYADLTPPAPPAHLAAKTNANIITLTWESNTETDLAGYRIYRTSGALRVLLAPNPVTGATLIDSLLSDGVFTYEVIAIDIRGNESAPSSGASVKIYAPQLFQPATPTQEKTVTLSGRGVEPDATVEISMLTGGGNVIKANVTADAHGEYGGVGMVLTPGENRFWSVATDGTGNVSKSSAVILIDYSVPPQPPTGLFAVASGGEVQLSWNPNAESDLADYRLYRRQGNDWSRLGSSRLIELSFTDRMLANATYVYRLTAVNQKGSESLPSAEIEVTVDCPIPVDTVAPPAPAISVPTTPAVQTNVTSSQVTVAGMAEPGATVEIYRNGVRSGMAPARETTEISSTPVAMIGYATSIAPDGKMLAFSDSSGVLWMESLVTGERKILSPSGASPKWAPDGKRIAFQKTYYDAGTRRRVLIYELEAELEIPLTDDPAPNESDYSWSRDGSTLVFLREQSFLKDVWSKDFKSGILTRMTNGRRASMPRLAPDATRLAFMENNVVFIADPAKGSISRVEQPSSRNLLEWSPDSQKLAMIGYANGMDNLLLFDLATQALTPVVKSQNLMNFSWSPSGQALVYELRGSNGTSEVWMTTTVGDASLLQAGLTSLTELLWSPSEEIFFSVPGRLFAGHAAGYFRGDNFAVTPGENILYARAVDSSGNQGASSPAVSVIYETDHLPDLTVDPTEIYLSPLFPKRSESVAVSMTIRNPSLNDVRDVEVVVYLWSPDGNLSLIQSEVIPSLAAGDSESLNMVVDAGSHVGTGSIIVFVDPANHIEELVESNNSVTKDFMVSDQEGLSLVMTLDGDQFQSDDSVKFEVELLNSGRATEVTWNLSVESEEGKIISSFNPQATTLAYGSRTFQYAWSAAGTFSGKYRIHLLLMDGSGVVAEHYAPFVILPKISFEWVTTTSQSSCGTYEDVIITVDLVASGTNNVLSEGKVGIKVFDSQSRAIFTEQKMIGSLLPGMRAVIPFLWNSALAAPGEYRIETEVSVGKDRAERSSTMLTVVPDVDISGEVVFSSDIVLTGENATVKYTVMNRGNIAIAGILQIVVVDPQTTVVLAAQEKSINLVQGVPNTGDFTFSSLGLALQSYQLTLKFVGDDLQQKIDTASFRVKDETPPEITVIAPSVATIYSSGVPLEVTTKDHASGIEQVEFQIDAREWQLLPFADLVVGRYAFLWEPTSLDGGAHVLRYRVMDKAGNSIITTPLAFEVQMDQSPPVTAITLGEPMFLNGEGKVFVTEKTTFTLNASDDDSGVARSEYRFDDSANWILYEEPFELTDLTYGLHRLHFRSIDNVTNIEERKVITVTLVGVEVETGMLNLPRILVWTEDPARHVGHNRPTWTIEEVRALLDEALGPPAAYMTATTDRDEFRNLMRSGIYNMVMILDQDVPLDAIFLREMREAVNRGMGLLVSSRGHSVPPLLQEVLGVDFRGSLPMSEEERALYLFASPVSQAQSLTAHGEVLRTILNGGTLAGILPAESHCEGLRSLSLSYPQEIAVGDQVTISLSVQQGKKSVLIDEEELIITALPETKTQHVVGNVTGDIIIDSIDAEGVKFSLSAPYGYLEASYTLSLKINRGDGSFIATGPVTVSAACSSSLRTEMSFGPFQVDAVDESRVKSGEDLPALVLAGYGEGKTAFFAYNLIESAFKGQRSAQIGLLQRAASWLLPETVVAKTGAIILNESRIRALGAEMNLQAVETLGAGLTHLPMLGLTHTPLSYIFHLGDNEQSVYRYFVQVGDLQGEYTRRTAIFLGIDNEFVPFFDYSTNFNVEDDAQMLQQNAP